MRTRWILIESDEGLVELLRKELGIPAPVARVLANRGVKGVEEAQSFLCPTLRGLHPPEGLVDMDRAVERVLLALEREEPIWIYGDYDTDGLTSVALLTQFLESAGATPRPVVPHRERDGYGFHCSLIPEAGPKGGLVITVDCGLSDAQEILKARARGIDVVVTDHHEVGELIPEACAVVNPKRPGNSYPFQDLAGVGVAFMLAWALAKKLKKRCTWPKGKEPSLKAYLDLVALGTVADQAPLVGENRTLVMHGLKEMEKGNRPGIRALLGCSAADGKPLSVSTLTYQLAPRLNAPGRVDEPTVALELLLAKDARTSQELASVLDGMNRKRQQIEERVLREAEAEAWEAVRAGQDALVLAKEGWHPGVLGIVASRLVDRFGLPVVLISIEDGVGKGSGRAPEGYHIMEGLRSCSNLLERFGGHRMAAGLRIDSKAVADFRRSLCAHARDVMGGLKAVRLLPIDDRLSPEEITHELVDRLVQLEPHGVGNPEPIFQVDSLEISAMRKVGQDHLKMLLRHGAMNFDAIGFGMAGVVPESARGPARLACMPLRNEWQGRTSIQLKVKDLQLL
ncbi:MAG: single-stranded-DNA-specific exonuclease RecJ [Thermodesulfobacteriota bacterium]